MSQQNNSPDCESLRALIPAYSVGATDPEETALVEEQLRLCPEVAAELDEYLALSQAMLYTVPAAQPPAHLHDRLMAAVSASTPVAVPPRVPTARTPMPRPRVFRLNRLTAGLAAVAAALLIISNVYWVNQVNNLRQQQQEMIALLSNQQDALTSLGTGRAQRIELVSTSGAPSGVLATVLWNPQSETALLYTDNLPALTSDQAYQLWLIQGSQPVSAGVFQLDPQGVGVMIFQSDQPVSDYNAVAISTEPVTGSEQPTTDPIALAQL